MEEVVVTRRSIDVFHGAPLLLCRPSSLFSMRLSGQQRSKLFTCVCNRRMKLKTIKRLAVTRPSNQDYLLWPH